MSTSSLVLGTLPRLLAILKTDNLKTLLSRIHRLLNLHYTTMYATNNNELYSFQNTFSLNLRNHLADRRGRLISIWMKGHRVRGWVTQISLVFAPRQPSRDHWWKSEARRWPWGWANLCADSPKSRGTSPPSHKPLRDTASCRDPLRRPGD